MISKVIVILGMGKSGTSLLSQILSKHYNLKDNIIINPITFSKEKKKVSKTYYDFYENLELKKINKDLLIKEDKLKNVNHNLLTLFSNFNDLKLKSDFSSSIKYFLLKKNKLIFKDPRTIINFCFWDKNLLYKSYIGVFRNPRNLCGRYISSYKIKKYNLKKFKISSFIKYLNKKIYLEYKKIVISVRAVRSWYIYNDQIYNLVKKNKVQILLEYENLHLLRPYTKVKIKEVKIFDNNLYFLLGKIYCKFFVGDIDFLYNNLKIQSKKYNLVNIFKL